MKHYPMKEEGTVYHTQGNRAPVCRVVVRTVTDYVRRTRGIQPGDVLDCWRRGPSENKEKGDCFLVYPSHGLPIVLYGKEVEVRKD